MVVPHRPTARTDVSLSKQRKPREVFVFEHVSAEAERELKLRLVEMDLIKTIEEDAEVQDFSEDSDAEVEVNI